MFCSNCGARINENASFCVKCGTKVVDESVPVNNQVTSTINTVQQNPRSGAATSSLVLGILGVVFSVISLLISLVLFYNMNRNYDIFYRGYSEEGLIASIIIIFIPAILSLTGFMLGLFSSTKKKINKGSKIAGIILNTIAIIICTVQVLMLTFA